MEIFVGILILFLTISHFVFATFGGMHDVKFKDALIADIFIIMICVSSYLIAG